MRRTVFVAAIALAALVAAAGPALAGSTVEATGEAEVSLPPDQAMLSLGVTTEASTAKQALEDNARAQAGFTGPDVATRAVSVTSIMDFQRGDQAMAQRAASVPTPIEPGLITVRARAILKAELR